MSTYDGTILVLKAATNVVGASKSWSFSGSTTLMDAKNKSSNYRKKLPGRRSWSVSAEGIVDYANLTGQKALLDKIIARQSIAIVLGKATPATGDITLSGSVFVENFTNTHPDNDMATYSVSLKGTGELTVTIA